MSNKCEPGTCREKEVMVCAGVLCTCRHTVCTSVLRLSLLSQAPALPAAQGTHQNCSPAQGLQSHSNEPAGMGLAPSLSHRQRQSLIRAGPGIDTALQSRWGMGQMREPHGNSERCLPAVVTVDIQGFTEAL